MNTVVSNILNRRAIRHYKPVQITDEELNTILEAGIWAPSAGGRQSVIFLVCQDTEANEQIGSVNRNIFGGAMVNNTHKVNPKQISIAEDGSIKSAFYGAPTVITLFSPERMARMSTFGGVECGAAAENMMLAAGSLGIGSVIISRAAETFATPEGMALMERAGIPEGYLPVISVCFGYPDGEAGNGTERREDRVYFVK